MSDLVFALAVDLVTVGLAILVLLRRGRIGHSHPASIYLFFHLMIVTLRLLALVGGAPTLFSGWGSRFSAVGGDEILRAALFADLGLVMVTLGSLKAAADDAAWIAARRRSRRPAIVRMLSIRKLWMVVALTVPLGVFLLLNFTVLPGMEPFMRADPRDWSGSSWILMPRTWPGLGLLALIYWYGFAWWLVGPMALYLLVMVYQGVHRFRVVLPLLLMLQIYLDRRRMRWPSARLAVLLVAAVLVFYPLKTIGQLLQQGESAGTIVSRSTEIMGNVLGGKAADQMILDQLASGLTLTDDAQTLELGKTYLALVTLPVPRPLWEEKPGLADHIEHISTEKRPMAQWGMVITYIGEAYVNFGRLGVFFIPALLGYALSRFYFIAYRAPYRSVLRFAYLLTACSLIQVYRDGLISLVVFTLVNMMPLVVLVLLHRRKPRLRPRVRVRPKWIAPAAAAAPIAEAR